MPIPTMLTEKMKELQHREPQLHAVLKKILQHKGGKGDYSADRHRMPEPDIQTIVAEIQQARLAEKDSSLIEVGKR